MADRKATTPHREWETAIHEAGHAVSCVRLNIDHHTASVEAHDYTLGRVVSAGVKHVWSAQDAVDQVISYCAGYAALIAAGYSEEAA